MNPCRSWSVIDPVVLQPMFASRVRFVFLPVADVSVQLAVENSNRTNIVFVASAGTGGAEISTIPITLPGFAALIFPQDPLRVDLPTDGGIVFGKWFGIVKTPGFISVLEQFFYPCK